jgi:hypothetical protein
MAIRSNTETAKDCLVASLRGTSTSAPESAGARVVSGPMPSVSRAVDWTQYRRV